MVKGSDLPDSTTIESLAILLSNTGVTQKHKILEPKVRVGATKSVALRGVVVAMVMVMGRIVVEPIPWMTMSSRGI